MLTETHDELVERLQDEIERVKNDPGTTEEGTRRTKCQELIILEMFQRHKKLTNSVLAELALSYGSRIYQLRRKGHKITLIAGNKRSGLMVYEYEGFFPGEDFTDPIRCPFCHEAIRRDDMPDELLGSNLA